MTDPISPESIEEKIPEGATPDIEGAPASAQADAAFQIRSEQSPGLGALLGRLGISLLVSTYQAGKVIVIRSNGDDVDFQYKPADKPMGMAVTQGLFAVGVTGEIRFYGDIKENCRRLDPPEKYDACFVERINHLTGGIDIHEMAFGDDGRLWFINTRFSALCTVDQLSSFAPVWRPSFVSSYAAEDRCHLNGLGLFNGKPRFVTALGESDRPQGWRDNKNSGGVLIDLADGKTICRGLSMPHSPRWYGQQLWVCESGQGTVAHVDQVSGKLKPVFEFPGFTRGLDFYKNYAFVGLSQIRESATFGGLPITERIKENERNCGIWIVDITTGELAGTIHFTDGVQEIFAVQVLPSIRYPEILNKGSPSARHIYPAPASAFSSERESSAPNAG